MTVIFHEEIIMNQYGILYAYNMAQSGYDVNKQWCEPMNFKAMLGCIHVAKQSKLDPVMVSMMNKNSCEKALNAARMCHDILGKIVDRKTS